MCGEGSVEKMRANWDTYVPKLLTLEKGYVAPPEPLDDGNGTPKGTAYLIRSFVLVALYSAKSPAVFSIHKVSSYICINKSVHITIAMSIFIIPVSLILIAWS